MVPVPWASTDVDVLWLEAGVGQCLADHPLLRGAVGGGEAVGGAVLVDGGALDRARTGWPFRSASERRSSTSDADALRPADPVGRLGEGLAAPVGGEAALAAELGEDARRRQHRDAAGQRQRALAPAQRLGGQVHRHQRGGAGGVDRHRRALEAEGVGDAAGGDAAEVPVAR